LFGLLLADWDGPLVISGEGGVSITMQAVSTREKASSIAQIITKSFFVMFYLLNQIFI
jgi:pyrroloquinoline quinone (PQQ) biosynthesis protein C